MPAEDMKICPFKGEVLRDFGSDSQVFVLSEVIMIQMMS